MAKGANRDDASISRSSRTRGPRRYTPTHARTTHTQAYSHPCMIRKGTNIYVCLPNRSAALDATRFRWILNGFTLIRGCRLALVNTTHSEINRQQQRRHLNTITQYWVLTGCDARHGFFSPVAVRRSPVVPTRRNLNSPIFRKVF